MYLVSIAARITTSIDRQYKDYKYADWRDCIFVSVGRRNPGWLNFTIVTPYLFNPKTTQLCLIYFGISFPTLYYF
jgi:hypothetical protein